MKVQTVILSAGVAKAYEGYTCSDTSNEWASQTIDWTTDVVDDCLEAGKAKAYADTSIDGCVVATVGPGKDCTFYSIQTGSEKDIRTTKASVDGNVFHSWRFMAGECIFLPDESKEVSTEGYASMIAASFTAIAASFIVYQ